MGQSTSATPTHRLAVRRAAGTQSGTSASQRTGCGVSHCRIQPPLLRLKRPMVYRGRLSGQRQGDMPRVIRSLKSWQGLARFKLRALIIWTMNPSHGKTGLKPRTSDSQDHVTLPPPIAHQQSPLPVASMPLFSSQLRIQYHTRPGIATIAPIRQGSESGINEPPLCCCVENWSFSSSRKQGGVISQVYCTA